VSDKHLLLKWGTVKGYENLGDSDIEIMKRFFADGVSMSCAMDKPDEARRKILCELIDQFDGEITNDWTGKAMDKDEAKKYVMERNK
jgi:hypothetical protein